MKRMQSTETLGSTSAINSDKTGTLTLNQMTAVQMAMVGRHYTVDGAGYTGTGNITRVAGQPVIDLDQFLLPMVLASDAVVSNGELIGDPTEGALVALAAKGGVDAVATRLTYPRIAELPFDADYKLMATFHRMTDPTGRDLVRCFVKGAPDQLLARAGAVFDADAGSVPVDADVTQRYLAENRRLGEQGLRVIATGRRDFDPAMFDPDGDLLQLVNNLELLTLVGIVDPPRPSAKASIATAKAAGIRVRMITGDHAVTATAIATQLGIEGTVLTGAEFADLTDTQALQAIDEVGVIARVTPQDKVRLVDLLQRKRQVVAMTGDGVNDAPALKRADIGIAMGITGTEVTKEAAVMILTDDNFSTIVKAVELGRGLYDNLTPYIRFQMGCLFGFIVTFLGSSILNILGGVPFLPLQTLWINFTTLPFQAIGLGYGQPNEGLMRQPPRPPGRPILTPGAAGLADHRRGDHGRGHPRRDQLGRPHLQRGGRTHHGVGHLLPVHPVLLDRRQGRAAHRVQPGHPVRQDVRQGHRDLRADPDRGDRPRPVAGVPGHQRPDRAAMAGLHRTGREHPGRLRAVEGDPSAPDTGRPGQPSTASQDELRLSTTGHRQRCTAVAGRPAARDGGKHPSTGPYDRTGPSRPARGSRSRRCPGRPGHLLRGGTACPS